MSDLRKAELPDLLRLMYELGLSIDGIKARAEALTRLMAAATEA